MSAASSSTRQRSLPVRSPRQHQGHRHAAAQLHEAGGHPTGERRGEVAAQPAVMGVTEQVVHHAEEAEGDHGAEDERPRRRGGRVADAGDAEQGSAAVDRDHGSHEEDAGGGGQLVPSVVLPEQGRVSQHGTGRGQQRAGGQQPCQERERDRHDAVSGLGTRKRSTTTGATMISIVKGTAIDESFVTRPSPASRPRPASAATVGRWRGRPSSNLDHRPVPTSVA